MGMSIKKFRAPTLQKAIELVRSELGDGAIILQADPIKSEGIFGKPGVEVTAALDRKNQAPGFEVTLSEEEMERQVTMSESEASAASKQNGFFKGLFNKKSVVESVLPKRALAPVKEKEKEKEKQRMAVKKTVEKVVKEASSPKRQKESSAGQMYAVKTLVDPLRAELEKIKENMKAASLASASAEKVRAPSTAFIESEIGSLRATLTNYINERRYGEMDMADPFRKLINFWKDKGMSDAQITSFFKQMETQGLPISDLESADLIKPFLSNKILSSKCHESPKQKIVVLVGPTGVGKTTTIAKLAAFEKLKLNRKVALVTIDDFKIGGTDQLAHYARILQVPFIKSRPDVSLEEQISHLDVDSVFIDTYGVAPRDDKKIVALRKALRFANPVMSSRLEVHLALPVGISSGDVESYLDGFTRLDPNYLLFTKWDETDNWGGMLATILRSERPVSFVGHGQEVPDDLSVFSTDNFVETITEKIQ